jgi:hypothetical protein
MSLTRLGSYTWPPCASHGLAKSSNTCALIHLLCGSRQDFSCLPRQVSPLSRRFPSRLVLGATCVGGDGQAKGMVQSTISDVGNGQAGGLCSVAVGTSPALLGRQPRAVLYWDRPGAVHLAAPSPSVWGLGGIPLRGWYLSLCTLCGGCWGPVGPQLLVLMRRRLSSGFWTWGFTVN